MTTHPVTAAGVTADPRSCSMMIATATTTTEPSPRCDHCGGER